MKWRLNDKLNGYAVRVYGQVHLGLLDNFTNNNWTSSTHVIFHAFDINFGSHSTNIVMISPACNCHNFSAYGPLSSTNLTLEKRFNAKISQQMCTKDIIIILIEGELILIP